MLPRAPRAWRAWLERERELVTLGVMLAVTVLLVVLGDLIGTDAVPPAALSLPILVGAIYSARRQTILLACGAALLAAIVLTREAEALTRPGGVLVVVVTSLAALALVESRERLGVPGLRGERILVELRERLRRQGELPGLPPGWHAEVEERAAGGVGFRGDFLVSVLRGEHDQTLELAVVDVSGKGVAAATRALQLSGALGALLGAVAPEQFLPVANRYLYEQGWEEGFATAVHLMVDLTTGDYMVDSAGHPPAAQFHAGSGRWALVEASGPALGLFADGKWISGFGQLRPGDALLLYTDGVIEVPGQNLDQGIDRLLGVANRLVVSTFVGGAATLVESVVRRSEDDRALVLIWRS